jgi:hypothetical protein
MTIAARLRSAGKHAYRCQIRFLAHDPDASLHRAAAELSHDPPDARFAPQALAAAAIGDDSASARTLNKTASYAVPALTQHRERYCKASR